MEVRVTLSTENQEEVCIDDLFRLNSRDWAFTYLLIVKSFLKTKIQQPQDGHAEYSEN